VTILISRIKRVLYSKWVAVGRSIILDLSAISGAVAGVLAVIAISSPDTVANYLNSVNERMSSVDQSIASVDRGVTLMAEAVPLWPIIDNLSVNFTPPSVALISASIVNPKNILIDEFRMTAKVEVSDDLHKVNLDYPAIIPPNSAIEPKGNMIREPWFMSALNGGEASLYLCLSGRLEGNDIIFSEQRVYKIIIKDSIARLSERSFELGDESSC